LFFAFFRLHHYHTLNHTQNQPQNYRYKPGLNTVGVWLISRGSNQFGVGIKSWFVAVVLGLVLSVVQSMVMMQTKKCEKKCC
ncbi:hypothetical protein L6273_03260, partial [Candidatus Parcubacteria bacterium]|nr:hypothetical protein [Candidatus Parcubacteria bacterium]